MAKITESHLQLQNNVDSQSRPPQTIHFANQSTRTQIPSNIPISQNNQLSPSQSQRGDQRQQSATDLKEHSSKSNQGYRSQQKEQEESLSIQPQKPINPKKCFNKLCKVTKIFKRIKSRIQTSKYRSLCKSCHANYVNNQFCEFCQQIYDNTVNQDDDLNWIGCDSCQRWNHISCEIRYRLKNAQIIKQENGRYQCVICAAKARQKPDLKRRQASKDDQDSIYTYEKGKKKTPRQVVNEERNLVYINQSKNYINIFNRNRQSMPMLEQMLHSLNYKLAISDEQIRQDLGKFRAIIMVGRQVLQDEDDEKKKRRKK